MKGKLMSTHTKTRHELGWIYRGHLLSRALDGGYIICRVDDSNRPIRGSVRYPYSEAELLSDAVELVDYLAMRTQAHEAIAAVEATLGKGHELTCQRAIHALGWDQDSEQAAELVRIYQGRA